MIIIIFFCLFTFTHMQHDSIWHQKTKYIQLFSSVVTSQKFTHLTEFMLMDVIIIDEIIEPDTVEKEKCVHHTCELLLYKSECKEWVNRVNLDQWCCLHCMRCNTTPPRQLTDASLGWWLTDSTFCNGCFVTSRVDWFISVIVYG